MSTPPSSRVVLTAEEAVEGAQVVLAAEDERARLHEVASTLAGIRSATGLLNSRGVVAEDRRAAMAAMVESELQRLERIVAERQSAVRALLPECGAQGGPADASPSEVDDVVDVDGVLTTLTIAHEAKGTEIHWQPTGALVLGDPDDLTEALNVLFDNAAVHGRGPVRVRVAQARGDRAGAEITVADDGPGVAPELRRRIFAWGTRGPRSAGQGIGLHIARDLMERHGGYLELLETDRGTAFVVGAPLLGHLVAPGQDAPGQDETETEARAPEGRRGVAA